MEACSQGNIVSKDQFQDNCFKRSTRSITLCFDALSYLCEYLLESLELSRSSWFSFYPHAFYSCILLRTSFISPLLNLLQSTKICVNHLIRTKDLRISETRHDRTNPITQKFSSCQGDSLFHSTEQLQLVLTNDHLNKTLHNLKTNHPNSIL